MANSGWKMLAMLDSQSLGIVGSSSDNLYETAAFNELRNTLENKMIKTVFQPIVALSTGSIIGYEALSRGPQGNLESPDALFRAAEKFNKVWELEFLCRDKALEAARKLPADTMLFINVDPKIINDVRFQRGMTREILDKYQMDASNIIFEITEKTAVDDYKNFRKVLDHYTSQGYKIAIDDTGSGYSGLKLMAETRPQFIKIDMDLVRDIDKDALKQALMKAFQEFSVVTNMKIIAEGIETIDELNTLISIGIPYGQGYFLQRPASEFLEIAASVIEVIVARNVQKKQEAFHTPLTIPIGELARQDTAFPANATGSEVIEYFHENPNIMGIPIIKNSKPIGLLMKNKFLAHLATQYGVSIYMNRPVNLIMDLQPLVVDYQTPLEQVSKFAISREEDSLYDYILVTKDSKYFGITTVKQLLEKTTQLEINRAKHSNPLSGLPGNVLVEEKLKQVIEDDRSFAVLYFDLDNFKAYNDLYGFDNGDKILCLTAQVIQKEFNSLCTSDFFVGHIGGDDFIAIMSGEDIAPICQAIIDNFDIRVRNFYNEQDQKRGYIIAKNRRGVEEEFPIVSLSIAVVTNKTDSFHNPAELAETAGKVKKKCKLDWKSCYYIE
ncbi:MAG TPA: GGDEF domain-containing protein [Negativicutes bacterium]